MKLDYRTIVGASVSIVLSAQTYAEDVEQISNVEIAPVVIDVISITPVLGVGLPVEKIPYNVQSSSGSDLEQGANLDITDFMERSFNSVNINEAANNPLQPDLQYRGFTASPLLGLPQGLAVYQNGVRMNEVFGDTINWDLIPEGSIHSMNLIGGSNPVFGLNTWAERSVSRLKMDLISMGRTLNCIMRPLMIVTCLRSRPVAMTVLSVTTERFNILMSRDGATHRRLMRSTFSVP